MADELRGERVAAVVEHGFEQVELTEPKKALEAAGAMVDVISPPAGSVTGWQQTTWGDVVAVDRPLADASSDAYDAVLLPGGVMNPDRLRMNPEAVRFVKAFVDSGKPIAAIGHGPWTLIEAELTLIGVVENDSDKMLAYTKARQVSGSFEVKNELMVEKSSNQP